MFETNESSPALRARRRPKGSRLLRLALAAAAAVLLVLFSRSANAHRLRTLGAGAPWGAARIMAPHLPRIPY